MSRTDPVVAVHIFLTSDQNIDEVIEECRLSGVRSIRPESTVVLTGRVNPFQIPAIRAIEDVRDVRIVQNH